MQRVEYERGQGQKKVYDTIKAVTAELAGANKWDVVIVNDSIAAFDAPDGAEMTRQISARRFLFADSAFDVSDTIIARLNR